MKRLLLPLLILSQPTLAVPVFDYFGPLPEATFGGDGIPNSEVAISSQFVNGATTITVAMSATQRYTNPPLTNDGAGTYFATTGSMTPASSSYEGALWNFNYYIAIDSETETLDDYQITLYYDFNPEHDNAPSTLGTWNLSNQAGYTNTLIEDSQNLLFSFLGSDDYPGVIAAPDGSFDPNAVGEYNFGISIAQNDWGIENVAMDVQVVSYVPVPAAAWLFGSALIGLVGIGRQRKM